MRWQVVVGLGNPGARYHDTRHSVGHQVVERLAGRLAGRFERGQDSLVADVPLDGDRLLLVKLTVFMNLSGPPVATLLGRLGLGSGDLLLAYDDLDLPFGTVRARLRGRSGGHRGVQSILDTLGSQEVRRVKVGIGRPPGPWDPADWVLTPFSPEEHLALPSILDRAANLLLALAGAARPAGP